MIIFLSGPITGIPNYNREAFLDAEIRLSSEGYTVLNPANQTPMVNPEALSHADYMHICYAEIDVCDAVYFLDGWEMSKGSQLERKYAQMNGKKIIN